MFFKDRQERFPKEFRIDSSDWDYQSILDYNAGASAGGQSNLNDEDNPLSPNNLKDLILRIWRINNKAKQSTNSNARRAEALVKENDEFDENESKYVIKAINNSAKPIKFIAKQSNAVLNILEEKGFEIKDHTNSKYSDGMAVKVLVFETSNEVEESTIIETIKPSIYYNKKLISNGEVIVAIPPNEDN